METISNYFIYFILYSFFGWFYETSLSMIRDHKFIKKGCFNGPLCPIYGSGAVIMLILLGRSANPVYLFLGGGFAACTLEYITSYFVEKWFHVRLWDYTKRRFNLNGRCCLLGFVVFGLFAAILILLVQPYVELCLNLLPRGFRYGLAALLLVDLIIDASLTIHSIAKLQTKLEEIDTVRKQYREDVQEKLQSIQQRNAEYFLRLNDQQQNLIRSFPNLSLHKHNDLLADFKRTLRRIESGEDKS